LGFLATVVKIRSDWFREAGSPPTSEIEAEVARHGALTGRALRFAVGLA